MELEFSNLANALGFDAHMELLHEETLDVTTFGDTERRYLVSKEFSLTVSQRSGGHRLVVRGRREELLAQGVKFMLEKS